MHHVYSLMLIFAEGAMVSAGILAFIAGSIWFMRQLAEAISDD